MMKTSDEKTDKEDYDKIISDCNEAIRLNPNDAEVYYYRGLAYDSKRDIDRAISEYSEAIRLNPNSAKAYNDRGYSYYAKKDYNRAIADYESALRINPKSYSALNGLSEAQKALENKIASPSVASGVLIDKRDGEKYKVVKIGNQTWMAENLNYDASGSKCYDNDEGNCQKYGRLYDWNAAMEACPSGWHLPSKSEYEVLDRVVGGEKVAGKKLKAKSGWNNDGNGTDSYGFAALPGGNGYSDGSFYDVGDYGYWWSASENDASIAYLRVMDYYDLSAIWDYNVKGFLFSVRCVKD